MKKLILCVLGGLVYLSVCYSISVVLDFRVFNSSRIKIDTIDASNIDFVVTDDFYSFDYNESCSDNFHIIGTSSALCIRNKFD